MRVLPPLAIAASLLAGSLPGGVAARAATVEVEVVGIEPVASTLYVALCQGGLTERDCTIGKDVPAPQPTERVVFRNIEPGLYAVAAFQDVDGNRRLDRTGLGLPLEPYGFSGETVRGARPDFARARFPLHEPGLALRVRLGRALPPR